MSFYEDSSIIITPNAYKAGTLYAVVPTSGLADMDVTRATAATRVDESGLVNYAEALGSELVTNGDFATDTDWSKGGGWEIIGGKAEALNVNGSYLVQNINFTNAKTYKIEFSISDYLSGDVRIRFSGGAGYISTDYVSGNNTHTLYLQSIGNTVFRIQGQNNFTASIDNVSVKEVIKDNVPRIDYTGGGCPHILAEPQRTNLITYSNDFSQSVWRKRTSDGTQVPVITNNYAISPDGTQNASRVIITKPATDNDYAVVDNYMVVTKSIGDKFTNSIYVKANGGSQVGKEVNLYAWDGNILTMATYALTDSWVRIDAVHTATTPSGNMEALALGKARASSGGISLANMATDFLLSFAQLEEGSYPTSYIPTSGASVTRNQDVFTRDGISSLINSEEGVFFAEIAALSDDGTNRIISLSDGTTTNRVSLILSTTANTIRAMVVSDSVTFDEEHAVTSVLDYNKIAIKYKENDFALWINGVEVDTDNSGNTPTGLNKLSFDVGISILDFFGKVKQLQVYQTALSDSELTILTTP